ncbi:unnamed protein product [Toxocara canis]|uniref:MFS domain-containing protein n=1 Tax=Toxocara canis TaxID=6265 RepID=A0A183UE66_TOXCA|nr:unnamed protein product [Toxocara canis]
MDFDSLLSEVGDFGRYQIALFFLICLPASLPSAFSAFNQPFVVGQPEHHCKLPHGRDDLSPIKGIATEEELSCRQYNQTEVDLLKNVSEKKFEYAKRNLALIPCQMGWEYDNSTYIDSLVTEFDLVCDNKGWVDFTSTAFYIGSFIGNILFGYVADKFGRRVSFFTILITLVLFGTINAFVVDVQSFTIMRFLTGLPFPALFQIPFIVSMEFMGKSGRIFSGIMIDVFFGVAMTLLGVLAMVIRRWRQLTFFCNAPFVILFVYYFLLPESPRWLVSVGKFAEAKQIIARIAKVNGRNDIDIDELIIRLRSNRRNSATDINRHNVYDLFKTPNLRKKTLLVTYIWFINAIVYNGLTFNISNLPVDDYVSFIINGAVELPAYFLVWPLLGCVGRRWTLASSMLLAGLACISTMFSPSATEHPWIIAGLAYVGKFGIAGSFAVIYIFAGELYPTVVRAIGMGMSSMVAGLGLILGPHLVRLGDSMRILPLMIMGTMSVSAGVASFFLPETLGAPLPQTLEEAEAFGKAKKCSCWFGRRFTFCSLN